MNSVHPFCYHRAALNTGVLFIFFSFAKGQQALHSHLFIVELLHEEGKVQFLPWSPFHCNHS